MESESYRNLSFMEKLFDPGDSNAFFNTSCPE
jgi:hypothetical protein